MTVAPSRAAKGTAVLQSVELPVGPQFCMLSIYYNLKQADASTHALSVWSQQEGEGWEMQWTKSDDTGSEWLYASMNINTTAPFRIQLRADLDGQQGFVAVDDISFRQCGLGEETKMLTLCSFDCTCFVCATKQHDFQAQLICMCA